VLLLALLLLVPTRATSVIQGLQRMASLPLVLALPPTWLLDRSRGLLKLLVWERVRRRLMGLTPLWAR
jgi:hypothetical protein